MDLPVTHVISYELVKQRGPQHLPSPHSSPTEYLSKNQTNDCEVQIKKEIRIVHHKKKIGIESKTTILDA